MADYQDQRAKRFQESRPRPICPECQRQLLEFPPVDRLLTPREAATFYRVSLGTIFNWIDKGYIRMFKISESSKVIRVPLADLMRLGDRFGCKLSITGIGALKGYSPKRGQARKEEPASPTEPTDNT